MEDNKKKKKAIPAKSLAVKKIEEKIFTIRGQKVMLDKDLAALYQVATGALNRAVKRNIERFPPQFMFQLTKAETENLKCQIGIASWGGSRTLPYAFTEHGVAMLSSVLKSARAIQINIQIVNTFVSLKRYALQINSEAVYPNRVAVLEKALLSYISNNDKRVGEIIEVINTMLDEEKPSKQIGFIKEGIK